MIVADNDTLSVHTRRVSDLGLATIKAETRSKASTTGAPGSSVAGSTRYMAPEVFGIRPRHSPKSDVYSMGLVLLQCATREVCGAAVVLCTWAVELTHRTGVYACRYHTPMCLTTARFVMR